MTVIALIQARMNSKRLPGKVMLPLAGKPMLWHIVNRVRQVNLLDEVIVATGDTDQDVGIVNYCTEHGIKVFAGSEPDVLDRYYHAARYYRADAVVRVTADCPCVDPKWISRLISAFNTQQWDHAGLNTGAGALYSKQPQFPDGLDAEIIRFASLKKAWIEARGDSEREHVTVYIWTRPQQFNLGVIAPDRDYSRLRLTVDTRADYCFLQWLYRHLYRADRTFNLQNIVALLECNPQLAQSNHNSQMERDYADLWST